MHHSPIAIDPLLTAVADATDGASTSVASFVPPLAIARWTRGASPEATLTTVRIESARRLSVDAFIDRVADAYDSIWQTVQRSPRRHIVRLWNGVPGIHDRVDADAKLGRDRYMLFNAGRYAAMRRWFGTDADLATHAPAASGVGIDGDDLVIHALSVAEAGVAVQNPRQTPAARYSQRYGPLPPCFARATRISLDNHPTLLVSGTAAILGEDSMHDDDLQRQLALTLINLGEVVRAASPANEAAPLAAYTSLRVYLPDFGERARIETIVRETFARGCEIEFVPAALCRRELLVEIEGIASLTQA